MNGLARISRISLTAAKRTTINKSFYSGSARVCGGAKPGHDDHGHDDHEHHDHPMWENLPFSKPGMAFLVFGLSTAGVGLVMTACSHQQKKHGFST